MCFQAQDQVLGDQDGLALLQMTADLEDTVVSLVIGQGIGKDFMDAVDFDTQRTAVIQGDSVEQIAPETQAF